MLLPESFHVAVGGREDAGPRGPGAWMSVLVTTTGGQGEPAPPSPEARAGGMPNS